MRVRIALLLVVVLGAAACATTDPRYAALPVPKAPTGPTTTASTLPPNLEDVSLPGVRGSTTSTIAIGPGPVTLVGRVDGPDGPVVGAIVRLQRLVGNSVASLDVPTATDGSWNAAHILGGHYRIRAWQQPSLGMARAVLVFVDSPQAKPVVLRLDRFVGTRVDAAIAPDPPPVGQDVNLSVRVSDRVVDNQGIVQTTPRSGTSVTLSGSGSWAVRTSNPAVTDATGTATFRLVCRAEGDQSLSVVLDGSDVQALNVPGCVPPPTTTTSGAPGSTTTTTSGR